MISFISTKQLQSFRKPLGTVHLKFNLVSRHNIPHLLIPNLRSIFSLRSPGFVIFLPVIPICPSSRTHRIRRNSQVNSNEFYLTFEFHANFKYFYCLIIGRGKRHFTIGAPFYCLRPLSPRGHRLEGHAISPRMRTIKTTKGIIIVRGNRS